MFIQYALSHPTYGIICIISIWVLLKVITDVKKNGENSNHNVGSSDAIEKSELPLPSGISTPVGERDIPTKKAISLSK